MQQRFSELHQFVTNTFSKYFAGFIILGTLPFFFMDTANIVVIVNDSIASPFWDSIMKPYTHLASGLIFFILAVLLLFVSVRYSAMMCVCGILVLIFSQFFKRVVFPDEMRPTVEFGLHQFSHIMGNFKYYKHNAFPSGHTMAAFAVAGLLSFWVKNKWAQVGFFTYAVLIGFSRIYLLHHFYTDVFWGAVGAYGIVAIIVAGNKFFDKVPNRGVFKHKDFRHKI